MSALTLIPEEKIRMRTNYSSKSMESLYSSSSTKLSATYYRSTTKPTRKPMNLTTAPVISEIRQRVKSARLLRVKHLQNELNDAQLHVTELSNENRLLRTLHKRQDSALSRYENSNAELPQLLHSHAEELRVWQTKYRTLHQQNCALTNKLKQKETMLLAMTDQNKHLMQLNKDKNLEDREKLAERVRDLDIRCMEKDEEIKLLVRRLQLESKNFKTQLSAEQLKYKELNNKYEKLTIKCNQSNSGSAILDFHRLNTKIPSSPFSRSPIKINYRSSRKSTTNRLNGNNNVGGGGGDNLQIPSIILNNSIENTEQQQEHLQIIKKSPDIANNSEHLNVSIRKLSPTTFTKYNQQNHYSQYQHKQLLPTTGKFSKNSTIATYATDATSSSITTTTTFSTASKDNNDATLNDKNELKYSVQNGVINLRETKKSINNKNYYSVKSNKLNELEEESDDDDDDDDDDDNHDYNDDEENENEFDLNLNDSKNKYIEEDEDDDYDDDDENNDDAENDDNDIEEENDQLDENIEENEKISKKQIDRTYQTPRYYNNSQPKYQELIKQNDNIDNNLKHNGDEDDNFDVDDDNDNKDNVIDQNNNNDDFHNLQLEMQNELLKNEATLDEYCNDTINETSKTLYSTQPTVKPQQAAALHRYFDLDSKKKNIPVSFADNKRQIIDPKKKIRLLEALKAIDSKNSKNNSSS